MIIGLSQWGVDVDVTPCLGKGFRIRGTSDSAEYRGKFFSSLEIKSFNENGIMQCIDGCLYQAIGPPSQARLSARIENLVVLKQIVERPHKNFHDFLTTLTSWTKVIQPLPSLKEVRNVTRTFVLSQLHAGKNILECVFPSSRQSAATKSQMSSLAQFNAGKESRKSAAANSTSSSLNLLAFQATSATAKEPGSSRDPATSNMQPAHASPPSFPIPDERTARVAARALAAAGISKQCDTSPITTQGDARAAARALADINEHCATSLLSLSFFQVHRLLQRGKYLHAVSVRRCALVFITEHCGFRV